jgi:hypothetical protein
MNIFKRTKFVVWIKRIYLQIINIFKPHDLSVIIEIDNHDHELTLEDFILPLDSNQSDFEIKKQMEHTDKILLMSLSRKDDFNYQYRIFIDDSVSIEFNEIVAYRWNLEKYLKGIERIVNLHTKEIKNSRIKYSARILFNDLKNPYLPFYLQNQPNKENVEVSAQIRIGRSFIYNKRIEMTTDSFKSLDDEILERVIRLKY